MSESSLPIMQAASVTGAGSVMDFGQAIEAVAIANAGPNTVYVAFGATAPTASVGDGRYAIPSGAFLNLDDLKAQKLAFRCATGETASVQAVGIPVGRVAIGPFGMTVSLGGSGSGSGDGDSSSAPPVAGGGTVISGPTVQVPLVIVSTNKTLTAPAEFEWSEYENITVTTPIALNGAKSVVCNCFDLKCLGDQEDGIGLGGRLEVDVQFKNGSNPPVWVSMVSLYVYCADLDIGTRYDPLSEFGGGLADVSAYTHMVGMRYRVYNPLGAVPPGADFLVNDKMTLAFSPLPSAGVGQHYARMDWAINGKTEFIAGGADGEYQNYAANINISGAKSLVCSGIDGIEETWNTGYVMEVEANIDGSWTPINVGYHCNARDFGSLNDNMKYSKEQAGEPWNISGKSLISGFRIRMKNPNTDYPEATAIFSTAGGDGAQRTAYIVCSETAIGDAILL